VNGPVGCERPPVIGASRAFDAFAFTRHLSGWALAAVLLITPCLFILPRYERRLDDEYAVTVPAITALALSAARFMRDHGIVLAPVALAHALMVALWYPRAGLGARRTYRLLLTLLVCGLFAFVILALFLPIVAVTNALSGAAQK
jgi:type II secretory pathway component PulF